jgi:hypothetical protein
MALLKPVHLDMPPITGVLIDSSQDGFRVRHPYADFQPSHIVSYIHRYREGMARVIWHLAVDEEFETGFEYLDVTFLNGKLQVHSKSEGVSHALGGGVI